MNAFWKSALRTPEGAVLLAGLSLSLGLAAALVVTALWSAKAAQLLAGLVATNLVFGRVAAMSLGYATGLDVFTVVLANALIETILVLLFYPLFLTPVYLAPARRPAEARARFYPLVNSPGSARSHTKSAAHVAVATHGLVPSLNKARLLLKDNNHRPLP